MMQVNRLRDLDAVKRSLADQGKDFNIVIQGARKTIHMDGKAQVQFSKNHRNRYFKNPAKLSVIRTVHGQVRKYIKDHDFHIPEIKQVHGAIQVKKALYRTFPDGAYFYHLDIRHAYWRFAYDLGYIKYKTYKKYCDDLDFKLARNIALSTLSSKKKMVYYKGGKVINDIICDDHQAWIIYKNIRYSTYNTIGELNKMLGDRCISYRVDGVTVTEDAIQIVKQYFSLRKLAFEMFEIKKVNDYQYVIVESGEIKNL